MLTLEIQSILGLGMNKRMVIAAQWMLLKLKQPQIQLIPAPAFMSNPAREQSVQNNIFNAKTGNNAYYALITESGITVNSNYNTYYTTNTNLFDYNGTVGNTGPLGASDLTTNPLFVSGSDYHIFSTNGSYHGGAWPPLTASGGTWTNDASSSPAIDAGNPADAYANEPVSGNRINQGAYGNTIQASKTSLTVAVNAGSDASICANETHTLSGATESNTTSLLWTTSGNGTFDDDTELNPVYTPGSADISAGTVTLTLTGQPGDVSDDMTLTVSPLSTADAGDCDSNSLLQCELYGLSHSKQWHDPMDQQWGRKLYQRDSRRRSVYPRHE